MDSRGNLYLPPEVLEHYSRSDVLPISQAPSDAMAIEDGYVAGRLALLNRRGRKVFYSERRRGASETDALTAAEASYR